MSIAKSKTGRTVLEDCIKNCFEELAEFLSDTPDNLDLLLRLILKEDTKEDSKDAEQKTKAYAKSTYQATFHANKAQNHHPKSSRAELSFEQYIQKFKNMNPVNPDDHARRFIENLINDATLLRKFVTGDSATIKSLRLEIFYPNTSDKQLLNQVKDYSREYLIQLVMLHHKERENLHASSIFETGKQSPRKRMG